MSTFEEISAQALADAFHHQRKILEQMALDLKPYMTPDVVYPNVVVHNGYVQTIKSRVSFRDGEYHIEVVTRTFEDERFAEIVPNGEFKFELGQ